MNDTSQDARLLQASFERLQSSFDYFSTDFYDRLFQEAPELRALFRDDLTGQGMKFMTTLREVFLGAQDAQAAVDRLAELGAYHASLGVKPADFAPMEEALITTLRASLGANCGAETEAAWRRAYGRMAQMMQEKGGIG